MFDDLLNSFHNFWCYFFLIIFLFHYIEDKSRIKYLEKRVKHLKGELDEIKNNKF